MSDKEWKYVCALCVCIVYVCVSVWKRVFVLLSGVTGSSEYFCQCARCGLLSGATVLTAEAWRTEQGCSCRHIHASICHWPAALKAALGTEESWGETVVLAGYERKKGHGGTESVALWTQWGRFSLQSICQSLCCWELIKKTQSYCPVILEVLSKNDFELLLSCKETQRTKLFHG